MATDSPPTKPVTLLDSDLSEMSKNETLKVESEGLCWVAGKTKHSFRSESENLTEGRAPTGSNEAKEVSRKARPRRRSWPRADLREAVAAPQVQGRGCVL